ncbi:MAG: PD-(D/E)XK nuclease family protein [Candidatus Pedobacter colombiensis]|uniref:PD-(D/E)XK nuclease family protein n=1 Tax=Candidatus Pedobacter colombiensis TaxID=3121371 RepID=A0AAJ5W6Z4_9SPHI|nr:PD-(D/E)XK nuclease family protein [Pedobacter sp.]WEK19192.1 MAG: PD-(D/E)XK nuclease family protein [Pedobacter sp.]
MSKELNMKPFLREVAEDLVARLSDNLQNAAIIFNNKRPVAYLQDHLAKIINKPFWSPSFFTIQEFFALSSELKVADAFTQFFTLYQKYNELVLQNGETKIEPAKFYPVARIILSDFAQIDNDLVNAKKLFEQLENFAEVDYQFDYLSEEQQEFLRGFWSSYSEGKHKKQQEQFIKMWGRMPDLYHGYHEALKEKGLTTMGHIYRQLAEGKAGLPNFTDAYGKLVFVGFNALSRAEAVVFKRWQEQTKTLFYFDTDAYYVKDTLQEAGLFLRKNLEVNGLLNALGASRDLIKANPKTVNVYKTQGQVAQAKILSAALQADYPLLKAENNAGKIALILADESLLLPVLQTIPTHYFEGDIKHPININVTMGYPLVASSIFGLADLWLSVQAQLIQGEKDTVYHREVEAFLSHPLTGITELMRSKIQQKLLAEQLAEVPLTRLQSQKGLLAMFFTKVKNGAEATDTLQAIFKHILEQQLAGKTLRQTEADLFVATIKELNRLHDALNAYLPVLSSPKELSFILSLIQKAVQGIAVPLSGEPLQGIQVMGLLESRSLDFEQVYILGVNEGLLPQASVSPSFIPDSIRRAYGLPVLENQDAISAYMFYRLLQRSGKVSLVYNAQADDTNTGEPTRFLRQLEYESGYSFNYLEHKQSISTEKKVPVIIHKDKNVMAVLNKYLTGEAQLSASALTSYVNCPLQFFYKYVAKIEEPEEISENLEANYIGSMLHYVLETFYRDLMVEDKEITKHRIAEYRKKVPELAVKAFAQVMFENENHQVNHNGMQKVVLAIVEEYANLILDYDENEAPFEILALEKKDKVDFKFKVNGGVQTIILHGIIDRIDRKNGITRIVDYKTGSDILRYSNLADVFDTNSNKQNKALIQTLFYTYVFEQANGIERVEPNLYSIRNMRKDGTFFIEGKEKLKLNGVKLESIKEEFIGFLEAKLAELFDETKPFVPTENEAGFAFSPYLTLCGM